MPTPAPVDDKAIEKALAHHAAHQSEYLEELEKLVRIPSVSFEGFDKQQVRRSAEATCDLMRRKGLQKVRMLEMSRTIVLRLRGLRRGPPCRSRLSQASSSARIWAGSTASWPSSQMASVWPLQ